jgi:predicted PurR-regulated permease PerM
LLKNRKIRYLKFIPILIIAFALYKIINNIETFVGWIGYVLSLISYILWAVAIAYVLNPPMVFLERKFKLRRYLSLPIVFVVYVGIIIFFVLVISPVILENIKSLLDNIPRYWITTRNWLKNTLTKTEWVKDYGVDYYIEVNLRYIMDKVNVFLDSTINTLISNALSFTSTLIRFLFGSVISIYLLKDKEVLIKSFKRFFYAFFSGENADKLMDAAGKVNKMFSRFLIGKAIDSLIIGILCFIGLRIMKVPFALLISLIVGVTNMIPYIGPIFGMIPAVILTFFNYPQKTLWVLLFIFILQQFDGFILGPKILGDSVGLSPIWVILAILLGGGLFGVVGMLLGVPLVAVVKVMLTDAIDKKLNPKNTDIKCPPE